jgi:hypothetical protein
LYDKDGPAVTNFQVTQRKPRQPGEVREPRQQPQNHPRRRKSTPVATDPLNVPVPDFRVTIEEPEPEEQPLLTRARSAKKTKSSKTKTTSKNAKSKKGEARSEDNQ